MSVQPSYWKDRVVLVTGASSGLGRHAALRLARLGARVACVARPSQRLLDLDAEGRAAIASEVGADRGEAGHWATIECDVLAVDQVRQAVANVLKRFARLDAVVHCVGQSMRGAVLTTPPQSYRESWETNFLSAVHIAQATVPLLKQQRGHFVAIGSLASRVGAPYLGAYPSAKAALAVFMQQLRLEHSDEGLHALSVLVGPIARADAGDRYVDQTAGLPDSARRPAGGARVRAIAPERLVDRILVACQRRWPEIVVPGSARLLFALAQFAPSWGDAIVRRIMRPPSG